jgi:hypothetical protein
MMVVTRRNARLVPFATRSCDLGCQECLRAFQREDVFDELHIQLAAEVQS